MTRPWNLPERWHISFTSVHFCLGNWKNQTGAGKYAILGTILVALENVQLKSSTAEKISPLLIERQISNYARSVLTCSCQLEVSTGGSDCGPSMRSWQKYSSLVANG